jgi:NAD(P)-dependent dehydrogenase (short-subunit alcohol dehydrogenase family)
MARLAGRKIIITGGASGIGRATARLFRREGAAVAILDRSDNAAKTVADEIGAVAITCDASEPPCSPPAYTACNDAAPGTGKRGSAALGTRPKATAQFR